MMVAGRFCQNCGQENTVPHQNFWGLIRHFIFDIFHFDGKFFETLRFLLFKPGFVPGEYLSGRRNRYLDPIRMYLFTSALFFLVFIPFNDSQESNTTDGSKIMSHNERLNYASGLYTRYWAGDSTVKSQLDLLMDTANLILLYKRDTIDRKDSGFLIRYDGTEYRMTS